MYKGYLLNQQYYLLREEVVYKQQSLLVTFAAMIKKHPSLDKENQIFILQVFIQDYEDEGFHPKCSFDEYEAAKKLLLLL